MTRLGAGIRITVFIGHFSALLVSCVTYTAVVEETACAMLSVLFPVFHFFGCYVQIAIRGRALCFRCFRPLCKVVLISLGISLLYLWTMTIPTTVPNFHCITLKCSTETPCGIQQPATFYEIAIILFSVVSEFALSTCLSHYDVTSSIPVSVGVVVEIPSIPYTPTVNHYQQQTCPVCTEDFQVDEPIATLRCRHLIHKSCQNQWSANMCTLCRGPIVVVVPEETITESV